MNKKTTIKAEKKVRKKREYRKKCEKCGTMTMAYRMIDIDGTNLAEHLVCLECGAGTPALL